MTRHPSILAGIYLILDAHAFPEPVTVLKAALSAGIRLFQYRAKVDPNRGLLRRLTAAARDQGGVMIVNDHVELLGEADGLHIGQDDLRGVVLSDLRAHYPEKILGVSAHLPEQLIDGSFIDYYGVGPFRTTQSKAVDRAPLGSTGLRRMIASAPRPVCAIGGIGIGDLADLRADGAAMAAVIGVVASATDTNEICRKLVDEWSHAV